MPVHDWDVGTASGNFRSVLKYNAKAARWFFKKDGEEIEIDPPTFVADFYNVATGNAAFREGEAPDRVYDPAPGVRAAKTREDQKRCLTFLVYANESFDGMAEVTSTGMHLTNALKDVNAVFREKHEEMGGKLPVIKCVKMEPSKDKFGTNYRPEFEIVDWVDRPADLPDEHPCPELVGAAANDNEAPATHVAPPAAAVAGNARPAF